MSASNSHSISMNTRSNLRAPGGGGGGGGARAGDTEAGGGGGGGGWEAFDANDPGIFGGLARFVGLAMGSKRNQ
jgi:hypothetical protein